MPVSASTWKSDRKARVGVAVALAAVAAAALLASVPAAHAISPPGNPQAETMPTPDVGLGGPQASAVAPMKLAEAVLQEKTARKKKAAMQKKKFGAVNPPDGDKGAQSPPDGDKGAPGSDRKTKKGMIIDGCKPGVATPGCVPPDGGDKPTKKKLLGAANPPDGDKGAQGSGAPGSDRKTKKGMIIDGCKPGVATPGCTDKGASDPEWRSRTRMDTPRMTSPGGMSGMGGSVGRMR